MRGNTISIELQLKRGKVSKTIPLYQYDYGQKLIITGAELPEYYEVHFSNEMHGDAVTSIGDSTGVLIPDALLATGENVYLWLYLHADSDDGETEFQGAIPVIKRAQVTDQTPTPAEQSVITQAIVALTAASAEATEAKEDAEAAQQHIENMGVAATTLPTDSDATVTKTVNASGEVTLTFGLPRGVKGDRGDRGLQGETGNDGADGEDGVSPSVSVTDITGGHRVSITDASGTETFDVMDGADADPSDFVADEFSSSSTYAVGDYVMHDGKLYECSTAVSTAGEWDSDDWTEKQIADQLCALKTEINSIDEAYAVTENQSVTLSWQSNKSWDSRDTSSTPRDSDGYQAASAVPVLPGENYHIEDVYAIVTSYRWPWYIYNSDFSSIVASSGAVQSSAKYDYDVTIPANGAWLCINCNSGTASVAQGTKLNKTSKTYPVMGEVVEQLFKKRTANNVTEWEQGGFTPTTGARSSSSGAIRTKGRIGTEHGDIVCASGYVMNIYCYNADGEYLGVYKKSNGTIVKDYIAWYDSANLQTIANGNRYTFQITVKLNEGGTVIPSDASKVTIKTFVIDKLSNGIDDINASALTSGTGSVLDGFIFGAINGNNGQSLSADASIRSMNYIPDGVKNIETSGNYVFYIFAFSKATGEYVGAWDQGTKTFKKSIEVWYNNLIVTDLHASAYNMLMVVKKSDGTTFTIADAVQNISIIVDNIVKVDGDLTEIHKKDSLESQADAISAARTISDWETVSGYVPPLTLLHFSDIHNDMENYPFIIDFKRNHPEIDDILNTGDLVGSYYFAAQVKSYFSAFDSDHYALLALGNHEYYTSDNYSTKMSQATAYGYYVAPTIEAWGAEYTANKTYWYKDYEDSKVRLIGIDNMLESSDMTAQVTWLEGVLADALEKDLAVVIAGHCPPTTQTGVKITSSFTSFQNIPSSSDINALDENGAGIQAAVDSFMDDGGEFVCYLMGHWHYDYLMYSSSYPNQLIIDIGTASHEAGPNDICTGVMRRDKGTMAQNLFNIFTVDRTDGLVRLVRIGADRDMYMKPRRVLCYDYKNHSLIYSE